MKKVKLTALILLIFTLILTCNSCSELDPSLDNKELRAYAETMLDAIISNDPNTAYALVDDVCTKAYFSTVFNQMRDMIGESDTYDLALLNVYYNTSMNDGKKVSAEEATYKMTNDTGTYIIYVQSSSLYEDLTTFNISPYEKTNFYSVGSLKSMKGATVVQWAFIISNLLAIGIGAFALIDCCRHTIKRKWIFLILIIFGFISVGATFSATSLRFNFNIAWLTAYSALIRYGGGTTIVRFMLPIGSIIYLAMRKRLTKLPEPPSASDDSTAEPEIAPETPFETTEVSFDELPASDTSETVEEKENDDPSTKND